MQERIFHLFLLVLVCRSTHALDDSNLSITSVDKSPFVFSIESGELSAPHQSTDFQLHSEQSKQKEDKSFRGIMIVSGTGLAAGLVHVLTGPDHLSALATVSVGQRWKAFKLGVQWGIGHSMGLLLIFAIFRIMQEQLNLDDVGKYSSYIVGAFMLGIGLIGVFQAIRIRNRSNKDTDTEEPLLTHSAENNNYGTKSIDHMENGEEDMYRTLSTQSHMDKPKWYQCRSVADFADMENPQFQGLAALTAGIVHGVAGPGGVLGVLPGLAFPGWLGSMTYLLSFFLASIAAMGSFASIYGELTYRSSKFSKSLPWMLALVSAILSIIVGVAWLVLNALGILDEIFE